MQFTTAYTSQQNGIAERKNRTILDMTRTMLKKRAADVVLSRSCGVFNLLAQLVPDEASEGQDSSRGIERLYA